MRCVRGSRSFHEAVIVEKITHGFTEPRIYTKPLRELTPETSRGFEAVAFAEQVLKIANIKRKGLLSKTLKHAAREVIGTAGSLGATIDGMPSKEAQLAVASGKYDEIFEAKA